MEIQRTCGTCTACCKTHGIRALNKPARVWCPHCQVNKGCSIYENRPPECKEFQCLWLMGVGNIIYRPDRTHIVPDLRSVRGIGDILWFFEETLGALNSHFVKDWSKRSLQVGTPVLHVPLETNSILYLPKRICQRDIQHVLQQNNLPVQVIPFDETLLADW